jgi:hypothetical protein
VLGEQIGEPVREHRRVGRQRLAPFVRAGPVEVRIGRHLRGSGDDVTSDRSDVDVWPNVRGRLEAQTFGAAKHVLDATVSRRLRERIWPGATLSHLGKDDEAVALCENLRDVDVDDDEA